MITSRQLNIYKISAIKEGVVRIVYYAATNISELQRNYNTRYPHHNLLSIESMHPVNLLEVKAR